MRMSLVVLSLVLFGGSACDKKEAAPVGGEKAPEKAPAPKIDASVVAAVEAKLPEVLKGKVAFEVVEGEKGRHLVVQPKGWETGVIPGRVKPPQGGEDLGFLTAFGSGSNCDGTCEPKDWATVADNVEFAQFTGGEWQVDKDEKSADGRLLVAKKDGRVDIAVARWKAGASRYFYCRATLESPLIEAAPAFEEACRQMVVVE